MGPGVRRDDGEKADALLAWVPAFAGMTVMKWWHTNKQPANWRAACIRCVFGDQVAGRVNGSSLPSWTSAAGST